MMSVADTLVENVVEETVAPIIQNIPVRTGAISRRGSSQRTF